MSAITVVAAVAPLVWLGCLVLTDWVPMHPLNDWSTATTASVRWER